MTGPKEQIMRWVGLGAGIWVEAVAGNGYMFPHFAPTLKKQLHLNQMEINNLGVAKDVGDSVGLMAGLLSNFLPPSGILLIGALVGFVGFGTVWLVMSDYIAALPFWQMCFLLALGANSTTFYNTAVLVTTLRNFPESRGMVVGILKGLVGLSTAIFTQVYVALLNDNPTDLVLFLAIAPLVVCLLAMYFIRPVGNSVGTDPDEMGGFTVVNVVCIGLALYLFCATLLETFIEELPPLVYQIIIAVMLCLLSAPFLVPANFAYNRYLSAKEHAKSQTANAPPSEVDDDLRMPLLREEEAKFSDVESHSEGALHMDSCLQQESCPEGSPQKSEAYFSYDKRKLSSANCKGEEKVPDEQKVPETETLLAVAEGAVRRKKGPRRGEDFTLSQALVKADCWLLFFACFCGAGSGLTFLNNLGQIGEAQGYSNVAIFVSLFAILNFLGRLGSGALSEQFVRSDALPRTVWMMAAQVLMIFGNLLTATALPGSLYVASVILGLCYGVHIAIMVPTASELFGLKHFGMIYNFFMISSPCGSLFFSGMLAGYIYDFESAKSPFVHGINEHILARYMRTSAASYSSKTTCLGAHCFQLTFFIMAVVCVLGFIANLVLTLRIRRVYKSLYASKSSKDLSKAGSERSSSSETSPP